MHLIIACLSGEGPRILQVIRNFVIGSVLQVYARNGDDDFGSVSGSGDIPLDGLFGSGPDWRVFAQIVGSGIR